MQVRIVLEVHREPGHFDVVPGHLEPGSVDRVRVDHVPDRRVHVAGRENQVCVEPTTVVRRIVVIIIYSYDAYCAHRGAISSREGLSGYARVRRVYNYF